MFYRLGNTDVSEANAQKSACIAMDKFRLVLNIVRAALTASSSKTRRRSSVVAYSTLIGRKKNREFLTQSMREVEEALLRQKSLPDRYRGPCNVLLAAVYMWTCNVLKVCIIFLLSSFQFIDCASRCPNCLPLSNLRMNIDSLSMNTMRSPKSYDFIVKMPRKKSYKGRLY